VEPEKGLHYLIEAFRNCTTDKKLVIAGGDSNHEYYRKLTDMAKGDDRILFIGQVGGTTTAELYSNAYVFTLPSNLEGMANTLLESMSYGCCDLVSDIPENTEVVGDHAVVFHKGNVTELQEKLQLLLDSPETVDGYRGKAADYITSKYNWDIIVEQMLRIYRGEKVEYETVWEEHLRSGKPTDNEKRT
jgi:glycosyltransferase involved in cell wall biosynthesis